MRILHVCLSGLFNDNWNYQDNFLTKYHKQFGHEVAVITSKWKWGEHGNLIIDNRETYINKDKVEVFRLNIKGKNDHSRKLKRYVDLYKSIEIWTPDIIFVHGPQFLDLEIIRKYSSNHPNIKLYIDNHADEYNSAKNWISKYLLHGIIWRLVVRRIEPYVTKFYGVLPARVEFFKKMYKVRKQVELLVLGADDELIDKTIMKNNSQEIRQTLNIRKKDFFIITGGKIDKHKTEVITLMKAVNLIEHYDVKLIVFGTVSDNLKDAFDKQLSSRVNYIGWLSPSETYEYFYASDLVCFPGLHSVFWEQAVALGKPCIFKYIKGFDHIDLGGNCLFLYENNYQAIKTTLSNIIEDKNKIDGMRKIAELYGKEYFSYREIAQKSIRESK